MPRISVIGARGGAGSSTLGLALARYLKDHDNNVNYVDSDPWQEVFADCLDLQSDRAEIEIAAACRHDVVEANHVLLLVPSEVRAITSAVLLLPEIERRATCHLIVRTPGPTEISPHKIEDLLKIPLAAVVKTDPKVALAAEHGRLLIPPAVADVVSALGL